MQLTPETQALLQAAWKPTDSSSQRLCGQQGSAVIPGQKIMSHLITLSVEHP